MEKLASNGHTESARANPHGNAALGYSGCYEILNTVNGKRYIGQTTKFSKRWNRHRNALRKGLHPNGHLQAAWNKYGESAFEFRVLERCDKVAMTVTEQKWMDMLQPIYNKAPAAGTTAGFRHSQEFCDKLRGNKRALGNTASLGMKRSPEFGAAITARQLGMKMPPNAVEKMRQSKLGKKRSLESRMKQGDTLRGRALPTAWRENISAGLIGKKHSEERCEKNRNARIGKTLSAAHAASISLALAGKKKPPRTPEHIEKIKASCAATYAARRAAEEATAAEQTC